MAHDAEQLSLLPEVERRIERDDWTFNGASTRELTHCYHDYPARMIPQVAAKILDMFTAVDVTLLFDPYCGTGTSLVEGLIRGINVIGTDLNPLARLITRVKITAYDTTILDKYISNFNKYVLSNPASDSINKLRVDGIRLNFWFKPSVIAKLCNIKSFIGYIPDEKIREFFQVAFSETVRESSNTRNEEFKLYRYNEDALKKFNPNVYGIMAQKLSRNRAGLGKFLSLLNHFNRVPTSSVYDFNSVIGIPEESVLPESVDIVVTSPPYGDSHTTVAYGQFSRLSSAWLGFEHAEKVDSILMGGKINSKVIPIFPCDELNRALEQINKEDEKRAREVASFYVDYLKSIKNVSEVVKPGGYACYVVGNRKVKGVVLPTDIVTKDFFEKSGFEYIDTFFRMIPNKRMPSRNSPTNVAGKLDSTMISEYIVVMRKKITRALMEKTRPRYIATRSNRKKTAKTRAIRPSRKG